MVDANHTGLSFVKFINTLYLFELNLFRCVVPFFIWISDKNPQGGPEVSLVLNLDSLQLKLYYFRFGR